jgi:exosortase
MGLGGGVYWFYGTAIPSGDQLAVSILAFVVTVWGVFLFSFGLAVCRVVAFGLILLGFMVPFPSVALDAIIGFLQRNSADAAELLFSFFGVPVFREGFIFRLSHFTVHVAEECSGIRSALSLFIVSLVAGYFFLRSSWTRLALLSAVVPLAIVKNAFRIFGLALLANYIDPTFVTDSVLHRNGGIPLFLISLMALVLLIWFLARVERRFGCHPPGAVRSKTSAQGSGSVTVM